MYAVTISMRALSQDGFNQLRQASLDVVAPSLAEEGCLFFDVLFNHERPLELRFYEAYTTREAFEAHLKAPHTQRWVELSMPYVDRQSVMLPESASEWMKTGLRRVVVFGATGKIGSEVVKLLASDPRCDEVIALSRNPDALSSQRLTLMSSKVVVRSSAHDQLSSACAGATDAFVIAPISDEMEAWHTRVAQALIDVKVSHVVKVSVTGARGPDTHPPPGRFPSLHWAGEEALRNAGLKTTVIRPTIFMQHFEMNTGLYTQGDDRFYLPTGDARVSFLDCRDIAAMGHALLLSPKTVPFHSGAYELTGPEAITGAEIATVLSAVRGAPVTHVDGEENFVARCAELGQPDWPKAVYAEAAGGWFGEVSTHVFEAVVGRKPRSLTHWADDNALWFT